MTRFIGWKKARLDGRTRTQKLYSLLEKINAVHEKRLDTYCPKCGERVIHPCPNCVGATESREE